MSRIVAPVFVTASLLWAGWSVMMLVAATFGDCGAGDLACAAAKGHGADIVVWRWLAVQLAGLSGFAFYIRRVA